MATVKALFRETRPQFLILSLVLSFLGTSVAWYSGYFDFGSAILATIGLLLAHVSVNVLNDYFDYESGLDLNTSRTPFSGGSGILPAKVLRPKQVLWFGVLCFLLIVPIGIYFVLAKGLLLLPLLLVAAACIIFYTPFLLKTRYPEWVAGLGLGTLPILGTYFVQGTAYTLPAIVASIPSGILVHNLLLLNEFPDVEADREAGRKTLPIIAGRRRAGVVYSALTLAVYIWIVGGVALSLMPVFSLLALLTLPLAIKSIRGALRPEKADMFMPAMASNVMVVLLTQLLLGIGYVLGRI